MDKFHFLPPSSVLFIYYLNQFAVPYCFAPLHGHPNICLQFHWLLNNCIIYIFYDYYSLHYLLLGLGGIMLLLFSGHLSGRPRRSQDDDDDIAVGDINEQSPFVRGRALSNDV